MKSIFTFLAALVLIAGCADSTETESSDTETTDETTNMDHDMTDMNDDWTVLFDGTSFEHWRGYRMDEMPEGWSLDGDAMHAHAPTGGNDIVTREQYQDFDLEFEWRVPEAGNSGVMFRVGEGENYPWATGPEYQLLDNAAHTDGKNTLTSAASNYAVQAPSEDATRPAGEWNTGRIRVEGTHVQHWLNGVLVVDYQLGSDDWAERVAASKWASVPTYGSLPSGHIALQGDHTEVWFRNVRIRSLA